MDSVLSTIIVLIIILIILTVLQSVAIVNVPAKAASISSVVMKNNEKLKQQIVTLKNENKILHEKLRKFDGMSCSTYTPNRKAKREQAKEAENKEPVEKTLEPNEEDELLNINDIQY